MSASQNPIPSPGGRPDATPGVRAVPTGKATDPAVRIPVTPVNPPPVPAQSAPFSSQETEQQVAVDESIGRPQLRTPEIKISTPPPPPAPKLPPMRAPRTAGSVWGVRLGLLAGVGVALAVLYWSVFVRLLPVTTEHNAQARQLTRLSDELELLRRRYAPAEVDEIKARYSRAQESVFNQAQELSDWETQVVDQARIATLDAKVKLNAPQPASAEMQDIKSVTAEVNLQADAIPGAKVTPYARVLKFTETLATSPKRIELMELSVTGDSNSVSHAQAVVQLLAGERKP